MATVVRKALNAYEKLKSARAQYACARTPDNKMALTHARVRFEQANRALARFALVTHSERVAA